MRVYILLDASGSMAGKWNDTLGALNAYVKELPQDTNVKLVAFDSGWSGEFKYNVLRNTTAKGFEPITESEAKPGGGTPLLDSMGKMLDEAFAEASGRAYFVVMTDGAENTSTKFNKQVIAEKLARAEDRDWEVVFLGASFDSVGDQARGLGLAMGKSLNISMNNMADEMKFMAATTTAYGSAGTRTVFTAADQVRAVKK